MERAIEAIRAIRTEFIPSHRELSYLVDGLVSQQASPTMSISPVSQGYLAGLAVGGFLAAVLTVGYLRVPAVHAQSSTWEVIAQPDQVAGVSLSLVRHAATRQCLLIVQSGGGVSATIQSNIDGLCDTPEEYEQRKWKWENLAVDDIPESFRMFDEAVQSSAQPSAPQTTKQPGVPR